MKTRELIEWLDEKLENIEEDKRKPGHGVCCTCQECGHCHDDCTCHYEKVIREVIKRLEELDTLIEILDTCYLQVIKAYTMLRLGEMKEQYGV